MTFKILTSTVHDRFQVTKQGSAWIIVDTFAETDTNRSSESDIKHTSQALAEARAIHLCAVAVDGTKKFRSANPQQDLLTEASLDDVIDLYMDEMLRHFAKLTALDDARGKPRRR